MKQRRPTGSGKLRLPLTTNEGEAPWLLWLPWSPAMTLLKGEVMKLGMALPWVLSTPSSGGRSVSLRDQLALPSLSCPSCPALSRTPGSPDLFASSTMEISAAAASNCSRRVAMAASNVQATEKTLCRRCRIYACNPPWSFCSPKLFFPLSRTAVALDRRSPEHTYPDPRKMASTCRYCYPFPGQPHLPLTSMRRLDARKASTRSRSTARFAA